MSAIAVFLFLFPMLQRRALRSTDNHPRDCDKQQWIAIETKTLAAAFIPISLLIVLGLVIQFTLICRLSTWDNLEANIVRHLSIAASAIFTFSSPSHPCAHLWHFQWGFFPVLIALNGERKNGIKVGSIMRRQNEPPTLKVNPSLKRRNSACCLMKGERLLCYWLDFCGNLNWSDDYELNVLFKP